VGSCEKVSVRGTPLNDAYHAASLQTVAGQFQSLGAGAGDVLQLPTFVKISN
jgi:hypothetical protein